MSLTDQLLLLSSLGVLVLGVGMVRFSIRAYTRRSRRELLHLAIGFALIVGAAAFTAISVLLAGVTRPLFLLVVYTGLTAIGYLFVVYSLHPRDSWVPRVRVD